VEVGTSVAVAGRGLWSVRARVAAIEISPICRARTRARQKQQTRPLNKVAGRTGEAKTCSLSAFSVMNQESITNLRFQAVKVGYN
jgi:hypothetical protein